MQQADFLLDAGLVTRSGQPTKAMLAAFVLSASLLAACNPEDGAAQAQTAPPAPEVTVAAPRVADVDVYDEVVGRFSAVSAIEIRPQVSGRLVQAAFRDGETVRAGDPLFAIDPAPFAAAADQARADLANAEAQRDLAGDEAERARTLVGRNTISQEEYDRRTRVLEQAEAAVLSAEARVRSAEIDLSYAAIAAPIDGRVSDRRVDPGNLVSAGETVLTTVVSQDPINVEFAVAPEIVSGLPRPEALGAHPARVQIQVQGEESFDHEGVIDFVDNEVDPRTGVVRLRAVVANPDGRFAPGQFVRVRFTRDRIEDAVLVPDVAVSSDQNYKYVLVVNAEDVVEPRPISAGPVIDGQRIVHSGLGHSDRVIVAGLQRAYPGMQVTTTTAQAELASR